MIKKLLMISGSILLMCSCSKKEPNLAGWWITDSGMKVQFTQIRDNTYDVNDANIAQLPFTHICKDVAIDKKGDMGCLYNGNRLDVFHYDVKSDSVTSTNLSTPNSILIFKRMN